MRRALLWGWDAERLCCTEVARSRPPWTCHSCVLWLGVGGCEAGRLPEPGLVTDVECPEREALNLVVVVGEEVPAGGHSYTAEA